MTSISKRAVAAIAEPAKDDSEKLSFRKWRRRTVEQIMSRKDLSPIARLTAYSIAERLHQATRSTPSSCMTLGRPVGLKPNEAQKGLDELVAERHVRIKRRENGSRDLLLSERSDIESHYVPVFAPSAFFKTPKYLKFLTRRAKFIDRVFADESLTPADKLIAFAATRLIEVESETIDQTFEAIGRVVGYSWEATRKSIDRLVAAGYFDKCSVVGKKSILAPSLPRIAATRVKTSLKIQRNRQDPGMDPGTDPGTAKSKDPCGTVTSSPIPRTPGVSDSVSREDLLDSDSVSYSWEETRNRDPGRRDAERGDEINEAKGIAA
jgi:hypothetical protein